MSDKYEVCLFVCLFVCLICSKLFHFSLSLSLSLAMNAATEESQRKSTFHLSAACYGGKRVMMLMMIIILKLHPLKTKICVHMDFHVFTKKSENIFLCWQVVIGLFDDDEDGAGQSGWWWWWWCWSSVRMTFYPDSSASEYWTILGFTANRYKFNFVYFCRFLCSPLHQDTLEYFVMNV